jgi:hypothetical protein
MSAIVIEHVLARLKAFGISEVFGVAGDYAFPVEDAIVKFPGIEWARGKAPEGCSRMRVVLNDRDRYCVRGNPIRDDTQFRSAETNSGWYYEFGAVNDTTRRDAHAGVVLRAAIDHMFACNVVNANQRVVGGHLRIVTVANRLGQPIQLAPEEPEDTVSG